MYLKCTYEDGSDTMEVLKFSSEDFKKIQEVWELMTHINYALSKHSQVFGVDTIKMIPAALIYVIEEQNLM